ncbi:class I SAM-dependent methyltransferase, partial [Thalassotalea piscium]
VNQKYETLAGQDVKQKLYADSILQLVNQKYETLAGQDVKQKLYADSILQLVNQKYETLAGQDVKQKLYIDSVLQLVNQKYETLAGQDVKQKLYIESKLKLLNQKQELLQSEFHTEKSNLGKIKTHLQSDIEKNSTKQAKLQSELADLLKSTKKEILTQANINEKISDFNHDIMESLSNEILLDDEYREWELQFENKTDKEEYLKSLISGVNKEDKLLDIGCGAGELIEYTQQQGIISKGIDISEKAIASCREKGLDVNLSDALIYLSTEKENTYDYVTLIHIIEHIPPKKLRDIFNLVYFVLKPKGRIFIETPNVQSLFTLSRYYYMDSTHLRPKHPSLIKFVLEKTGFRNVELNFSDDIPENFNFSKLDKRSGDVLNEILFSGGGNIYLQGSK